MVEIVNGKEVDVEVISQEEAATLFGSLVNGRLFTAIVAEQTKHCRKGVDDLNIAEVSEIRANKKRYLVNR